jgi:flagellar biosynthesis GTPase FlhF
VNEDSENPGQRKIVEFPQSEEEHARRLRLEVERLAQLPVAEWLYYLEQGVAEKHGIEPAMMREMVEATIKAKEKQLRIDKAEERTRVAGEQRTQARKSKAETEKEERERKAARKEEERKRKELAKELESIAKLPEVTHELRLMELAKRLAVDIAPLREELQFFIIPEEEGSDYLVESVEPWEQPVDALTLLNELIVQIRRYIVNSDESALAIALWVLFAWCHEAAYHSPPLLITSTDPISGKSTLARVVAQLCPRPKKAAEPTLASIFRTIHHYDPALLLDEADSVFLRNAPIAHLINDAWEKGSSVSRVRADGRTQRFNIFGPKIIAMKGKELPEATASRCINIKLVPRIESEKVESFRYRDDDVFRELRRKCLRWAADNIERLRDVEPAMPPGVINRAAANWRLPFGIADLAGGNMSKRARTAAIKLLAESEEVRLSVGQRVLMAIEQPLQARKQMLTQDLLAHLHTDAEWADFRGRGKLNEWQLAKLLKPYGVGPTNLHPIRGSTKTLRGYRFEDFKRLQIFERHIPRTARKHTTAQAPKKPRK